MLKNYVRFCCIFMSITVIPTEAGTRIQIDNDKSDCVNGWVSMDVNVRIDDEIFKFTPSCKFSFNENFKTKDGVECKIDAGMCSAFSPRNKIEVSCAGGFQDFVLVDCPK